MTKEVLLSLRGLQFDAGSADGDKIETITPAEYYKRNDSHYVVFDEVMEGFQESTRNIIKFKDNSLDLTKKGLVNVHMIFEEKKKNMRKEEREKKNMTNYATPYGNILIGIDAKSIKMTEEEERIEVSVDYALEVNYEHLANCKIRMDIRSRGGEGFSLQ